MLDAVNCSVVNAVDWLKRSPAYAVSLCGRKRHAIPPDKIIADIRHRATRRWNRFFLLTADRLTG